MILDWIHNGSLCSHSAHVDQDKTASCGNVGELSLLAFQQNFYERADEVLFLPRLLVLCHVLFIIAPPPPPQRLQPRGQGGVVMHTGVLSH